jgi:UDP-N-acetyl-D-glucosamine dehydrogenase
LKNNTLYKKIENKSAKISVVGLGYVGLPLVIRFAEEGFNTIGIDIDKEKVEKLNSGLSYINHISSERISSAIKSNFFSSNDFGKIAEVDIIIICVPTPLGIHNEPDISYIETTMKTLRPFLKEDQLLILESTTYPGTTEEIILPIIEHENNSENESKGSTNFSVGKNFFVGYSPEREDPGNQNYSTKTIPKVVSGITKDCLELTMSIYGKIIDTTVPVSSTRTAEMTKILENIHRAVNIGLVNELKMVVEKMNINIYEVIEAASTKPFGFTPYYPGPGLGGHCIPIDPFYLTWKAKEFGMNTKFIELAGEINTAMPNYVISKMVEVLNNFGKSIKGSRVLILGLSYKKNIDDSRESPSLKIIDLLNKLGANVEYSDPYLAKFPKTRKFKYDYVSVDLNKQNLKEFDLVALITDHDSFDYDLIQNQSKMIIDTRNRFKNGKNIVRA